MKLALENKQGDMQIPDEFIYIAGSLGISQVYKESITLKKIMTSGRKSYLKLPFK